MKKLKITGKITLLHWTQAYPRWGNRKGIQCYQASNIIMKTFLGLIALTTFRLIRSLKTLELSVVVEECTLSNFITYVAQYSNKWLFWKAWKGIRHDQRLYEKLYNSSKARYQYELDWVSILNSLRQLNTLKHLLLTEHQLSIMKFSK